MAKGNSVASSMVYKTMERYIIMAFQMLVQIVIARILSPSDYGVIAMMTVFISVASVFIHNGFNMALVQKKDANETDYATAFTINLLIGLSLYLILVCFSSVISDFYNEPALNKYFPVIGLLLVIGSLNSIQIAIANRQMLFKQLLRCTVISSFLSGSLGIIAAYLGLGAWALVVQQLGNSVILCVLLFVQQHWKPKIEINKDSAKSMFNFGWKLLVAGLLNQVYNELNSLVIGKKYTSSDLAFYTKGSQFPKSVAFGLDSSIGSVIFSALSKKQDDPKAMHDLMMKAMTMNTYLVFPFMAVLGMVAEPFTIAFLTEKWLPMVPFMQLCCLTYAFHPVGAVLMQALAAVGRSDMRLKLEFAKKGLGVILLIIFLRYGPMGIAVSAALTSILGLVAGAIACNKVLRYSYGDTIRNIFPALLLTILSSIIMNFCLVFEIGVFPKLIITSLAGLLFYFGVSVIVKPYGYKLLLNKLFKKNAKHTLN